MKKFFCCAYFSHEVAFLLPFAFFGNTRRFFDEPETRILALEIIGTDKEGAK